jgi:hypothetical protein
MEYKKAMKILTSKKEKIIKKIENLIQGREEIIFAYIFGSFIEEESFNDIDIAIYLNENKTSSKSTFYEIELSNQIEKRINMSIDIIRLNFAPDSIVHRATKGLLIKNDNDNLRINYITTCWKKYWDYQKIINEYILELKNGSR